MIKIPANYVFDGTALDFYSHFKLTVPSARYAMKELLLVEIENNLKAIAILEELGLPTPPEPVEEINKNGPDWIIKAVLELNDLVNNAGPTNNVTLAVMMLKRNCPSEMLRFAVNQLGVPLSPRGGEVMAIMQRLEETETPHRFNPKAKRNEFYQAQ